MIRPEYPESSANARSSDQSGDWQACPAGEIAGMVRQLRGRRTLQRTALTCACGSALVVLLAVAFQFPWGGRVGPHAGDISCREVWAKAEDYLRGTLDGELIVRIQNHLQGCQHCREVLEERRLELLIHSTQNAPPVRDVAWPAWLARR